MTFKRDEEMKKKRFLIKKLLYIYIKGIPLLTALFFSYFIFILIFNFIIVLWSLCHIK